ncbi:hypothetical protein [Sphingobium phenoxybenzoativorans]|uniref:hypothetical protein n=1 Tax=Sphingobium phenoxybenzoativorans TaxID=1592790 RepID=UPI001112D8E9|nr:hypothetical protein [Sphingobium phenoxybenzoativorans]
MRKWLIPGMALFLVGCQPPPPFVIAMVEAGKLTFHVRHRGIITERIFGWDDEKEKVERLSVFKVNRVVALFEKGGKALKPCQPSETFPVTLGERRCGYRWTGDSVLPASEHIYEVYLNSCVGLSQGCADIGEHWADQPVGRFRLYADGSVDNIRPN